MGRNKERVENKPTFDTCRPNLPNPRPPTDPRLISKLQCKVGQAAAEAVVDLCPAVWLGRQQRLAGQIALDLAAHEVGKFADVVNRIGHTGGMAGKTLRHKLAVPHLEGIACVANVLSHELGAAVKAVSELALERRVKREEKGRCSLETTTRRCIHRTLR